MYTQSASAGVSLLHCPCCSVALKRTFVPRLQREERRFHISTRHKDRRQRRIYYQMQPTSAYALVFVSGCPQKPKKRSRQRQNICHDWHIIRGAPRPPNLNFNKTVKEA